jgi:hypothetical protein
MMAIVVETKDGIILPVSGNPTLTSLDGEVRAPLAVIMHESWTDEDRAKFGVHLVEPATLPDGKRVVGAPTYERRGGVVVEVVTIEDIPAEPPDTRTALEKAEAMSAQFGLTIDELRAVLAAGAKQ